MANEPIDAYDHRVRNSALRRLAMTLMLGAACGCDKASAPLDEPLTIRIGTSGAGGSFQSLAQALAPEMKARLTSLKVEMVLSQGAVDNLADVARGDAECGFTYADTAYEALMSGQLEGAQVQMDNVRAIAVLQVTPVQLVARAHSGISGIEDLRGRHVGVRSSPSGLISKIVAEARAKGTNFDQASSPRASMFDMMAAGELDAVFGIVMRSEGFAAAIARGGQLVPITGPLAERLRQEQPFLRTVLVPAGIYGPSQVAVPTIGVESLLVCQQQLGDAVVHDLARALLESLQVLAKTKQWNLVSLDEAAATSIPLHAGAALYYREIELRR